MGNQRVAVLMGGVSAEREGSLAMGRNCAAALREAGYDTVEIDAGQDVAERLLAARPEVAFNALMGRWGEDGAIQGLLEWMQIPYTHSGVLASAVGMDKARSRAVYRDAGLPVAEGRLVHRDELAAGHPMAPPYVLKPNAEGSSIGIHFVLDDVTPPLAAGEGLPEWFLVEKSQSAVNLLNAITGGPEALRVPVVVIVTQRKVPCLTAAVAAALGGEGRGVAAASRDGYAVGAGSWSDASHADLAGMRRAMSDRQAEAIVVERFAGELERAGLGLAEVDLVVFAPDPGGDVAGFLERTAFLQGISRRGSIFVDVPPEGVPVARGAAANIVVSGADRAELSAAVRGRLEARAGG